MKKLTSILALIIFTLCIVLALPTTVASAQELSSTDVVEQLISFSNTHFDRTPGSQGERDAAYYIARCLMDFGLVALDGTKDNPNAYLQHFEKVADILEAETLSTIQQKISSNNVVAYLRCNKANAKLLVIGCSYGNTFSINVGVTQSHNVGVYESGSDIFTLLSIAQALSSANNLDFDVAFAFFGAQYYQCMGATAFIEKNSQPILGYINLYAVGGGDNLNIYCDEVKTAHEKLFVNQIAKYGYDVKQAPFDKHVDSDSTGIGSRPYSHIGLNSANNVFIGEGIPSVNLFGYNWSKNVEKQASNNVIGTSNDAVSIFDTLYTKQQFADRMALTKNIVVSTVLQNNELQQAFEGYNNGYKSLYSKGAYYAIMFVCIAIAIALFVIGFVFASKVTNRVGKPDFATNSQFFNGNQAANNNPQDDIFGFGDSPIEGDSKDVETNTQDNSSSDDDDDIFGEF